MGILVYFIEEFFKNKGGVFKIVFFLRT